MPVTGPDFISLQARDLDASQAFYEQYLGLVRSPAGPPHAVVFQTKPIAFAVRDILPGTDLASVAQPGIGAAIWLHATDVQAIHDALVADGHTIVSAPIDGPFGRTVTFADPDGPLRSAGRGEVVGPAAARVCGGTGLRRRRHGRGTGGRARFEWDSLDDAFVDGRLLGRPVTNFS
jgi:catechol 2,3-dioxygenase-like lactoylglutathione lyase family enzyme